MLRRTGVAAALAFAALVATAVPAGAQSDLRDDLNDVQSRIDGLRSQVSSVRGERTDLANSVLDTAARLEAVVAELDEAERILGETEAAMSVTRDRLDELEAIVLRREQRIEMLRRDIDMTTLEARDRAVELYMAGNSNGEMGVLSAPSVASVSVGIFYAERVQVAADQAVGTLESLKATEGREVALLEADQADLEDELDVLEVQQAEQRSAADAVDARRSEVQAELDTQRVQLDEMDHEIAHIEGEIAALAAEEEEIKALIRQESGGNPNYSGGSGVMFRPVPGGVSSGFGYRIHPIYGTSRLHTGWDMNAGCGEPIYAAESGTVIYSGWRGGYGNAIIIDHGGGIATLYGHQSALGASYGQRVSRGDVIGWIGTTGVSTGCHLHFEVRVNGNPVDPTPYL